MADRISGNSPKIKTHSYRGYPVMDVPPGWTGVYSQSGVMTLLFVGPEAVVPSGTTAEMECYHDALSPRSVRQFAAGTLLRIVRKGDPHNTCIVDVG